MRSSDSPYLADWFAISLRWLILLGLAVALAVENRPAPLALAAMAVPVAWNLGVSILAIFNRRLKGHRFVNVLIDALAALAIFLTSGGLQGPVVWVGILPVTSAAIYYEFRGSLLVAVLISALQAGGLSLPGGGAFSVQALVPAGLNLAAGLVIGFSGAQLMRRLRRNYQLLIESRMLNEQRVQRQERERLKAIFGMIEAFSATLNYRTALEAALDASQTALNLGPEAAARLVSAVLLFEGNNLQFATMRGMPPHDAAARLPAESGVLSAALRSGEPQAVQAPTSDPELSKLAGLHDCAVALCLPLLRGMNAYGVLLFAHPDPAFFTRDRVDILHMISNQAVIAIQNARLFEDLAGEKGRIIQTQEEAQKKLARDLHDGPTQSVSTIAMRINIARRLLESDPGAAAAELKRIEDLARRTTQEIRHMLFTLRPLVLETEGLTPALQLMAAKFNDVYQQKVSLDVDAKVVDQLDINKQTVIFYLVEEAVNNARKYAESSEIWVRLRFVPNQEQVAVLEVIDSGKGFDVQQVMGSYERRGSLGMINLRERADLINGLLHVDSAPGKGTRVRVFIPLTQEAVDRLHQSK